MSDSKTMEQLLNEVQTISESYERVAEATGENFNIFSVLKKETDEVTTHSQFIAELLNPKGSHGQKDEFLKIFFSIMNSIKTINERKILTENIREIDLSDTHIVKEKHIGPINNSKETGGNIDLVISSRYFDIIIENKIDAIDQHKQLVRYHNYLNSKENNKEKILLYLTLGGHSPENFSISSENGKELKEDKDFYCISYENHIIEWLEECKEKAVDIPILRESISQYINLIKKLTNQNLNKQMSEEIAQRILKDKQSYNAFKTLVKSKNEISKIIMEETVFPFLKEIEERYQLKLDLNKDKFYQKEKMGFFYEGNKLKENNLQIKFRFEQQEHKGLVFGFRYIDKTIDLPKNLEDIKEDFENYFGNYKTYPNAPCNKKYEGFEDWQNLNTLEKIHYGNFKEDFEDKIKKMLSILE